MSPAEIRRQTGKKKVGPVRLQRGEFVLISNDIDVWLGRIEDVSLLEACQNRTLVHTPDGKLLIRRTLSDCERRLDRALFFRASRQRIVNLNQVKRLGVLEVGLVLFLKDGREVPISRRQAVFFRESHYL